MGLFDFLNKGDKKPAAKPAATQAQPQTSPLGSPAAQRPAQPAPAPAVQQGPRFEMYTVKEGDWLSKIAGRYYGDVHKWSRIYDANRDQISDPDKIRPGMVLKIPLDK
jgi:nucleoid-associated protein YgaU